MIAPEPAEYSPSEQTTGSVELELSSNAMTVLRRRYLKKDGDGNVIEEPEDMFRRVAECIAAADRAYDKKTDIGRLADTFYGMMARLEFMPNSPTLMNAGRELGQLSACFVLPVEDSMESIFNAVKNTALIHKSGGGTGFSFSRIRPQNDIVRSTQGIASGPISFLNVFDAATETVKQGGTRRGANMAIMRVDHPDILEFITCKEKENKLNNFNISVAVTEPFWTALQKNGDYELINPHSKECAGTLNAKEVFEKIVDHAWKNGEPGIIFIDRVNSDNPTPHLGEIESTNPCGEQPLLPYESCNLGSINLSRMVRTDGGAVSVDYDKLRETVRTAVHFLDNVIDVNRYPLETIEKQTKSTRKIGLGVMGFADLLSMMNISYMSVQAIDLASELMSFINREARCKSEELAVRRGPFPAFAGSVYGENGEPPIRNATRTTIAPTGTISIISGCSSGIEPLFALAFTRHVMDDDKLTEIHPIFCRKLEEYGLYSDDIIEKVVEEGSIQHLDEIPDDLKGAFQTSHDITPEWHIKMQAAFQEHTDNAVSKTVNFKNEATREDVADVYTLAHDLGCKGVTIYRDGSRSEQVLNKGKKQEQAAASSAPPQAKPVSHERPVTLQGFTSKLNTGQGSLYVTVNTDTRNRPVEVFANIGKSGGDTSALSEAIGRLISIALQNNVDVTDVSKTLIGITGSRPIWNDGRLVKSVPDGIGQILMQMFGDKAAPGAHHSPAADSRPARTIAPQTGPECPDCYSTMETEGGCSVCHNCGYSHCG
ncbi:vitamin B12-dependent ribonucleotide reductase [bacterium]|nr:vitamin B12-dependent ribonucleotide reductase [bacterium]